MKRIAGLGMVCLLGAAVPVSAGFPVEEELSCPVGGEKFVHTFTASSSTWGARPDGKPYGSWIFPMPIPECPSNGLVMYREFDDDEIGDLASLIATDDYATLREESTYYRAQWLYDRLDSGNTEPPWLLMRAGWQADDDPARKARYQREFAIRAAAIEIDEAEIETLYLRFRVANAWRELSEFARANTALDTIPLASLDVEVPEGDESDWQLRENAEARIQLLESIGLMRSLIEADDASSEPFTMIPEDVAIWKCAEQVEDGVTPVDDFCTVGSRVAGIKEARAQLREVREWEAQEKR